MRAMVLHAAGEPLRLDELPVPEPAPGQVLLRVAACGVCRTDLHVVDGELPRPKLPLVPGHQIVGRAEDGRRLGVPWLGWTGGTCRYCASGRENLCDAARFTGYDLDGGYAECVVADERYCLPIPDGYSDVEAAPLLCAGLIGYRSLRLAGDAERARALRLRRVGAHRRAGRALAGAAAVRLRARTATRRRGRSRSSSAASGRAGATSPRPRSSTRRSSSRRPASSCPRRCASLAQGGTVVCAGIHMSDIPSFPYELLWEERSIRSVANLTRRDGEEFLAFAPQIPVRTEIEALPARAGERGARPAAPRRAARRRSARDTPGGYDRSMSTLTYNVPGVSCAHCQAAIVDEVPRAARASKRSRSTSRRRPSSSPAPSSTVTRSSPRSTTPATTSRSRRWPRPPSRSRG